MVKASDYVGKSRYLKATDVHPPIVLTITGATVETVGQDEEEKLVAYFDELSKGLVLNATNTNSIRDIAKTDETDDWKGVTVEAYKDTTDFGGKRVDCVRLQAPRKKKSKTEAEIATTAQSPLEKEDVPF